jgi:hypothetical protein
MANRRKRAMRVTLLVLAASIVSWVGVGAG